MILTEAQQKEAFSVAYFQALAAVAGYAVYKIMPE